MSKKVKIASAAVLEELRRRQELTAVQALKPVFDFDSYCFPIQKEFFRKKGPRFRSAVCSRRAGKSQGIGADMIDTCLTESNVICLYLTLSKRNARNIIWGILKQIIADYKIDCKPNEVEMSIVFPNGSKINIEGAKDRTEIEKYRGWKLRKCYIDECQSFRNYIEELVNDIIAPALRDLRGELYLTGTPGPIPAGYFFKCSQSVNWNNFKWTAFDNPHMHNPPDKDLHQTLLEERTLKGISELDASYRRETFGEWTEDLESLVFKYKENVNNYEVLPPGQYTYIMGADIGYEDADAIAILAYSKDHNKVYLVEEYVKAKQTIAQLAEAIIELDNHYNCVKKVIDAGALGKKIVEEIVTRYGINLEAADKKRKFEYIELLNSDLRKGTVKARAESRFAEDCRLVQWDKDKSTPDRLKVSDVYHSDITDAVLYAYREARHYLYKAPDPVFNRNSTEFMLQEEERLADEMEQRKNATHDIEVSMDEVREYEKLMGF